MTGPGVFALSSHSAPAGRTTFSANPWTHSRMSFWSWFSAIENSFSGAWPLVGTWASAARVAASGGVAASIVLLGSLQGERTMVLAEWSVTRGRQRPRARSALRRVAEAAARAARL